MFPLTCSLCSGDVVEGPQLSDRAWTFHSRTPSFNLQQFQVALCLKPWNAAVSLCRKCWARRDELSELVLKDLLGFWNCRTEVLFISSSCKILFDCWDFAITRQRAEAEGMISNQNWYHVITSPYSDSPWKTLFETAGDPPRQLELLAIRREE